jgi:hypothetical protein
LSTTTDVSPHTTTTFLTAAPNFSYSAFADGMASPPRCGMFFVVTGAAVPAGNALPAIAGW